jgi:prepilin-type N-terminal cleavage/methylation domain-containing protein/prepilin-type processing-associated H-X9-DG protein
MDAKLRSTHTWGARLYPFGFTLMEMLIVIAILLLIAGILFPLFLKVRGSARQGACLHNLQQIGLAFGEYMQEHDNKWPLGLDPADKYTPQIWRSHPEFQRQIPFLPLMHELLAPYVTSPQIWKCPADKGQIVDDVSFEILQSYPSSFEKFGTSYYYRTELTVRQLTDTVIRNPSEINVYFDGSGAWHSGEDILRPTDSWQEMEQKLQRYRYNVLFADFHVKNLSRAEYWEAWSREL